MLCTLDVNITLMPETVEVVVGENITLECQINISNSSHMNLSWSGPISHESVSVVYETSLSDGLVAPAKESYNGSVVSCNVSVYGTIYNASAILIVTGNH